MSRLWKWIKEDWELSLCYVAIGFVMGTVASSLIGALMGTIFVIIIIKYIVDYHKEIK